MWKGHRVPSRFTAGAERLCRAAAVLFAACCAAAGQTPGNAVSPSNSPRAPAPQFAAFQAELFTRIQAFAYNPAAAGVEACALHRTRLDLALRPAPWISIRVRGEDSRALAFSGGERSRNPGELSLVQMRLNLGGGWAVGAGRQELSFGDERLVGSDSEWGHIGARFDAVRLSWERRGLRIDAFLSSPVVPHARGWDPVASGGSFHGVYAVWSGWNSGAATDAYLLWKKGHTGGPAARRATAGLRHVQPLGNRWGVATELAVQWGEEAMRPVRAWAGHLEAAVTLGGEPAAARLIFEYNLATGDDPATVAIERFDDLYPAGHDAFALPDPVPWSDMQTAGAILEWTAFRKWSFAAGGRSIGRTGGRGGRLLGWQASGFARWEFATGWQLCLSYSRMAAGAAAYYGGARHAFSVGVRRRIAGR